MSNKDKETVTDQEKEELNLETVEAAKKQAVMEDRKRTMAIIGSDEAIGHEVQAKHLAYKTSMIAEDAIAILATAPIAPTAENVSPLAQAMANTDHPEIGPVSDVEEPSKADTIFSSYQANTGYRTGA